LGSRLRGVHIRERHQGGRLEKRRARPTAIAKGAESFHRAAKVLDGQLKGKKFVTGDR